MSNQAVILPKPPGNYKKFQGRNPEIISLQFWDKLIFQKDIIKLTDLYLLIVSSMTDPNRVMV